MINLSSLEKCYLSCLFNGADIQDITLSQHNEPFHREVKRLKERGFVQIPSGIIPDTESTSDYNQNYLFVQNFAEEIREAQRKIGIKKAINSISPNIPSEVIIGSLREELDKLSEQTGRSEIYTARKLLESEFENTEFIIDKMLPVGMTLLIGAPKIGKSWLLLLLAECITLVFPIFGHTIFRRMPVLYYTLEDSVRRCKYRLNKLKSSWNEELYFSETARGTRGLINDIKALGVRVVIIDTFGAFSTVQDGNDYYETTRIIREIKEIADTLKVAIILVHHTRESRDSGGDWTSEIMGSQGLVGAADAIIALNRKRDSEEGKLLITGRDISDSHIDLKFDDGVWVRRSE
ncbi:MAG: helicase RepA family protein [Treponema sp.]|nr:helicase RepA family protein [Treponema sp.]